MFAILLMCGAVSADDAAMNRFLERVSIDSTESQDAPHNQKAASDNDKQVRSSEINTKQKQSAENKNTQVPTVDIASSAKTTNAKNTKKASGAKEQSSSEFIGELSYKWQKFAYDGSWDELSGDLHELQAKVGWLNYGRGAGFGAELLFYTSIASSASGGLDLYYLCGYYICYYPVGKIDTDVSTLGTTIRGACV